MKTGLTCWGAALVLGVIACDPAPSMTTSSTSGTTSDEYETHIPSSTSVSLASSDGQGDDTTSTAATSSTTSGASSDASSGSGSSSGTTSGNDSSSSGSDSSSSSTTEMDSSSGDTDTTLRVFVSSTVTNAALGGTSGADTLCTNLAASAGLGGTWSAWLSTSTVDAADRIDPTGAPYALVDGTVVANDLADLLDGSVASPINRDENGSPVASDVWTGTLQDGTAQGFDCGAWTSAAGTGHCGAASQSDFRWTNNVTPPCGAGLRVYCFEDGA